MRRTPWTRLLAALMAVWLPVLLGEPGLLHHHCPMHDGTATAGASVTMHGAHAGHGDHDASPESGAPHGEHHACTCIGACSASGATATLPAPIAASLEPIGTAHVGVPAEYATPARPRVPFALPFPNGPPVAPIA
ncbi:MAG TPA: hypothetical protein VF761_04935 [Gemmatimonadaceae bacterium]